MDQSPRKRVTRARVAAKAAAEANSKAKNKTTAAPKAGPKSTTTTNTSASTAPTLSSKRKIRSDEIQEREEQQRNKVAGESSLPPNFKTTRTRTRRTAPAITETEIETKSEPERKNIDTLASKKPTRGRPRKVPPIKAVPEPTRTLRGRVTKANDNDEALKKVSVKENPQVGTRRQEADPINTTATTIATTIAKPAESKRCVKFEQPGKENIFPSTTKQQKKTIENEDAPGGTGFRAKPVRKPVSKARATRSRTKPATKEKVVKPTTYPLSPKNLVNGALKEYSDDELALSVKKTPSYSPLKLSPKKPTARIFSLSESTNLTASATNIIPDHCSEGFKDEFKTSLTSPARRPPQNSSKDGTKMPALKIDTENFLVKPNITCTPASRLEIKFDSRKHLLFNSPARRALQSPANPVMGESPLKLSNKHKSLATTITRLDPSGDESSHNNCDTNFKVSRAATSLQSSPTNHQKNTGSESAALGTPADTFEFMKNLCESNKNSDHTTIPETEKVFSGRMSSIVPREIYPTLEPDSIPGDLEIVTDLLYQQDVEATQILENQDDSSCRLVNKDHKFDAKFGEIKFDPYSMRTSDSLSEDSDSEDEISTMLGPRRDLNMTSTGKRYKHLTPGTKVPSQLKWNENIGFTPLAQQLSHWMSLSPTKSANTQGPVFPEIPTPNPNTAESGRGDKKNVSKISNSTPSNGDKENVSKTPNCAPSIGDSQTILKTITSNSMDVDFAENGFEPFELDREDLELALEANEMSLLDTSHFKTSEDVMFQSDTSENDAHDSSVLLNNQVEDKLSDEAAVPDGEEASSQINDISPAEKSEELDELDNSDLLIDPQLLALPPQPEDMSYKTPKRIITQRIHHTVCKIPLKPEASVTPVRAVIPRSASACRIPAPRPSNVSCNDENFLNMLANDRKTQDRKTSRDVVFENSEMITPSKQILDMSSFETPARTPRPDLNTSLLRGAVVFVDVYTAEGADASYIFTEVLTLMGARCVKSWPWSGNIEEGKIGITHVVFKDGGKRTMEKVREGNGLVTCVGVGWVLDCERENKWLDETPYLVDTAVFPREGNRRRKSMEPRALANMNGTLVPWPNSCRPQRHCSSGNYPKETSRENDQTPMTSKSHRRDSIRWHHMNSQAEDDMKNKPQFFSPLPPTPGPEALAAYEDEMDESYQEDSSVNETDDEDSDVSYFLHKDQLVQKTAPVKRYFNAESGSDLQCQQKGTNPTSSTPSNFAIKKNPMPTAAAEIQDKNLMMRLMAARRKSLQWAPKIGSPLARAM